mgnify:CR=1 FL=1
MEKFRDKYRIQSTRLNGWDYANPGFYFVTICVTNRGCVLGKIENKKMILSPSGEIAESEWLKTSLIRKNVQLDVFQIMPNHLHGIIIITDRIGDTTNSNKNNNSPNRCGTDVTDGLHDAQGVQGGVYVETRCTVSLQSHPYLQSHPQSHLQSQSQHLSKSVQILLPEQYIRMGFSRTYKNKFGPQKNNLSSIIGGFKSATTVSIRKDFPDFKWQNLFDDHLIRDAGELNRIRQYIIDNPKKWTNDEHYK